MQTFCPFWFSKSAISHIHFLIGSFPSSALFQVCRHGDRAPMGYFPNSQHRDYWVQGTGYLTPKGQKDLFDYGVKFRTQWYPGLLSDVIYPWESYVISSDVHRAIMSVDAFFAGLYPPTGDFEFESGLRWQAFPTHTISTSLDYVRSSIAILICVDFVTFSVSCWH